MYPPCPSIRAADLAAFARPVIRSPSKLCIRHVSLCPAAPPVGIHIPQLARARVVRALLARRPHWWVNPQAVDPVAAQPCRRASPLNFRTRSHCSRRLSRRSHPNCDLSHPLSFDTPRGRPRRRHYHQKVQQRIARAITRVRVCNAPRQPAVKHSA